jgi:iron complex outermembrane receptor protein
VTIDPAMVQRVEVLRGATSVYGEGATGGVINIITRQGAAGPARLETSVSTESSLSTPGDGTGGRITQSVSGKRGALDYSASAAYTRTGGFYDAEGDRIPSDPNGQGGISDLNSWDAFGKLGLDLGEQRVQLTANYFRADQDTDFASDPAVNEAEPGALKARVIPGLSLAEDEGSENVLFNLDYSRPELLGSRVHAQAYYRDYLTRFGPYDGRAFASMGNAITQSFVDSDKVGGRLDLETPLPFAGAPSLLWGLDYTDETVSQPVSVMDPDVYEQSGGLVFRKIGERTWTPEHDVRDVGLFAQLSWSPFERFLLRGGVRHERARVAVDDFTTLAGVSVRGGELEYAPTLFNAGAVLDVTEAVNLYASFSQGFSLADIGRVLRAAPAGFVLGSQQTDAQEVDQYEAGVRGAWSILQASLSAYRNTSDLGTGFDGDLNVVRAPERIHGVEATLDVQPARALSLGGTFTWAEGESYAEATDEWLPLDGYRIQPPKVTAYVEHRTLPRWENRLQLLYSGSRDRLARETPGAYGAQSVKSYTVVDLLSTLRVGPGTLNLGVQNLLNEQYFPIISQLSVYSGNLNHAAARGATLNVGYSVSY